MYAVYTLTGLLQTAELEERQLQGGVGSLPIVTVGYGTQWGGGGYQLEAVDFQRKKKIYDTNLL